MTHRIDSILNNLRKHVELYATLIVCVTLLMFKIFHKVDAETIGSAVLLVLMLITAGSLRDRKRENEINLNVKEILDLQREGDGLKWYIHRSEATPDMMDDIGAFSHLVFIGISHHHLGGYLSEKIQKSKKPLPWKTIEVFFASDAFGSVYEGEKFGYNIKESLQQIAATLTDPEYKKILPQFSNVSFYQCNGIMSNTGSMFGNGKQDISLVYSVHSTAHLYGDTQQGLTIRLAKEEDTHAKSAGAIFEHYSNLYRLLTKSSLHIGKYHRSVWDCSVQEWESYAKQSDVLKSSMATVADIAKIRSGEKVLDLCAGSGSSSEVLLSKSPKIFLTILDGSPQMIRMAKNKFSNHPSENRISFELFHFSNGEINEIDIARLSFDLVIIHQCLGDLKQSFGSIEKIASWCSERLVVGGRVLVSAHNGIINTNPPKGFEQWEDPFRLQLQKQLEKDKKLRKSTRSNNPKLESKEIDIAFSKHGFKEDNTARKSETIDLSYEDRQRMWNIPAVMDSVIDIRKVSSVKWHTIVDKIACPLIGKDTMPRTMVYWLFVKK